MAAEILINVGLMGVRIARLENGQIVEYHNEKLKDRGLMGNIYRARVERVLPGMQAAFLDVGLDRTVFLHADNVLDIDEQKQRKIAVLKIDDDEEDSDADAELAESKDASLTPSTHVYPDRKIENLIKEGHLILVQVVREPLGTKGAQVSGYLSIPGRFLVYLPEGDGVGISKRIEDDDERKRLKEAVEAIQPKSGGVIIRTVAVGATAKHLKDDMDYILKQWGTIKKAADKQKKVGLVHSEQDMMSKFIRDRVGEDVERIVIDDLNTHKKLSKFIQSFLPRFKNRLDFYADKIPLFERYGIEGELQRALGRKVWLKSGGYIIVDQAEALTAIDVNTGRFVGRKNFDETIFQTNLEAVKEIAYQVRLRNLGAIIVLDFIDMTKESDQEAVTKSLMTELEKDPVRTQVYPMTELGLIQMTRKRTQDSLLKQLTQSCHHCEGRGYVKSQETVASEIFRECEKEARQSKTPTSILAAYCHPRVAHFISTEAHEALVQLESRLQTRVAVKEDAKLHFEEYEIFAREN